MFEMDLSGHWDGFYVQDPSGSRRNLSDSREEERFPIEVWIEQSGSRFSGNMRDKRTERFYRLSETVNAIGFFGKLRFVRFLKHYPEATMSTVLPAESRIDGHVAGSKISFRKEYIGHGKYVITFGERTSVTEVPGIVFYTGMITKDENVIEGPYRTTQNLLDREYYRPQPFRLARTGTSKLSNS
jgi:hypothetical protein